MLKSFKRADYYSQQCAAMEMARGEVEVPRAEVPIDTCDVKHAGAPSPVHDVKRAGKCTISRSPQCYKLQEFFLLIQSGIEDSKNALLGDNA